MSGVVACNNGTFGDPIPSVLKQCSVFAGGTEYNSAEGSEIKHAPSVSLMEVTYVSPLTGASVKKRVTAGTAPLICNNELFGGDPSPFAPKHCQTVDYVTGYPSNGGASPAGGVPATYISGSSGSMTQGMGGTPAVYP
jgi:hypothetical protein